MLTLVASAAPSIRITHNPVYGSTEDVAGAITGADPASVRVAVYIFVYGWYNKPNWETRTVPVQADGTWTADITTNSNDTRATRIAAFLVPSASIPPVANGEEWYPQELYPMTLAMDQVYRGNTERVLDFAGYKWLVKTGEYLGPGPNNYSNDPNDVWADSNGMHLSIAQHDGMWWCSEVVLQSHLGFGSYVFTTRGRLDTLDPNVIAGMFTYDLGAVDPYREIDIEYARWGNAADPTNAQFVMQPYATPGNLTRYTANQTDTQQDLTHVIDWSPGIVRFRVYYGKVDPANPPLGQLVASWNYTGPDVPVPGWENFRFDLWLRAGLAPTNGQPAAYTVTDFSFHAPGQLALPDPGSVQVQLSPVDATAAGAKWKIAGSTWQDCHATVPNLCPGQYSIEFQQVAGWTAPAPQVVTVAPGQTAIVTAAYQSAGGGNQPDDPPAPDLNTDLATMVAVSKPNILLGESVTVDATLQNIGTEVAANGWLKLPIPQGTRLDQALATQGSVNVGNGYVEANLGAIAPGGSATVSLLVTLTADEGIVGHEHVYHCARDAIKSGVFAGAADLELLLALFHGQEVHLVINTSEIRPWAQLDRN